MHLTAIVIARNEEDSIGRCLKSLSFADEIIVIDAHSEDQTAKIARQYGARVYSRQWVGFGAQKNFGAAQASYPWLLFVDADEEVTPALAREITATIAEAAVNFYWLKIVTVFMGKTLRHLFGHNARLFKKSAGQWTLAHVHEQVARQAEYSEPESWQIVRLDDSFSRVLQSPLLHHSHATIRSYLNKMHQYTTLDAKQMAETGRHRLGLAVKPRWWLPYYLAGRQGVKLLFYRRGILDGWQGWVWCVLSGYYEYEVGRKYIAKFKTQNAK